VLPRLDGREHRRLGGELRLHLLITLVLITLAALDFLKPLEYHAG
jgi:hypothetical protein